MAWLNKQNKLFKKFYEKTGIQLTDEPIYQSDWERQNLEDLAFESQKSPSRAIPTLKKAIQEYPKIAALKNYLYIAYMKTNQTKKADEVLAQTLKEHPNYVFGVSNKLLNIKNKGDIEAYEYLLGKPKDVRELEGYDKPIHISAFKNYQHAAAHYEILTGKDSEAVARLETLIEVGVEQDYLDQVAQNLAYFRIYNFSERFKNREAKEKLVDAPQKVYLEVQNLEAPVLTNPSLEILYQTKTKALKEAQQKEIITLPREALIKDLTQIIIDAMSRWSHYEMTDFEEETHDFLTHALYFLGALKAESSLQVVLDLFRMGHDFIDFWFADWIDGIIRPVLYDIGATQFSELKAFVLEENIGGFHKLHASWVVSQVGLHQPEKRPVAIQWFKEVLTHFLSQPTNKKLIDTNFLSWVNTQLIDLRAVDLLPIIKEIWNKGWIQEDIIGDIKKIEKELKQAPHPSSKDPLPENIHEYYSENYLQRKVKNPYLEDFDDILAKTNTKAEKLVTKFWSEAMFKGHLHKQTTLPNDDFYYDDEEDYYIKPTETVKRLEPKVGRNAPCPCGSGKKYKKCCLRK